MRNRIWITLVALVLLPAAGAAQDAQARIDAAMAAAANAEIPRSLLESKLNEGRARGVAAARIASALEARLDALLHARRTLAEARAGAVSEGELSLAADALQAGVSETAVVAVMTRAPRERRAVATAVLTQLVQLGMASDVALGRVNAALARGGQALVNLPAEASAGARGRGPAQGQGRARGRVNVGPPAEIDAGVRGGVDANLDLPDPAAPGRAAGIRPAVLD